MLVRAGSLFLIYVLSFYFIILFSMNSLWPYCVIAVLDVNGDNVQFVRQTC